MENVYKEIVSLLRDNKTKKVKFFIHNLCDKTRTAFVLSCLPYQNADVYKDNDAHILKMTDGEVVYRVVNNVYVVPATIKAVVNNDDGKLNMWFDYPKDMDEKGLVEY